jgi:serine/threonine protein kinase/tetratricopeptide (TPR) repeat protein/TolB-like protein
MIARVMPSWPRVKEILGLVIEQPPERRAALLEVLCAGDDELRAEVESLLTAEAEAGSFLVSPAVRLVDHAADADPHLGLQVGPYLIEQCLGRGGMGAVYLGRRTDEFEHSAAIKMIRRGMDSELVIRRFRNERQILASLSHPHIARLFDGGTTPAGLPYFVMEYVAGTPIDHYADAHRLTTAERLRLCLPVFDAVGHAHDRHIVHRDLKPSNVLVTAEGQPKLLDFGIAKILDPDSERDSTMTSLARPMTPDYASPEQILGRPVTPATDVYALGLLLYELLTGHRPFRFTGHSPEEISSVVCEQEPERPSRAIGRTEAITLADGTTETTTPLSVSETRDGSPEALRNRLSGPLDAIVMKALRKVPESRYPSVAALADDVRRWLDERPVAAGRDEVRYRTRRFLDRHRSPLAVGALLLAAIALTAVSVTVWTRASRRSAPAEAGRASTAQAPRPSIAVAGFTNLSGRAADQWLSTAMAEMLTTELAGGGQVRVVPADIVTRAARDLQADTTGPLSGDAIERLRSALGTDYLVLGSFATSDGGTSRAIRIDVHILRKSEEPVSVSGVGEEARLFSMIAETGGALRSRLGLQESTADATKRAGAAFPESIEAMRLYSEGLARLRLLDAVQAQALFAQAAARESANPMIQTALASAWTALGYDGRAKEAAQKAFDASGALTREDRLNVEGRLYEAQRDSSKAIDVYRTLWGFFSDNIEYGLRLAGAQSAVGRHRDALATIAELRRAPAPQNADPRIDLAESLADSGLGDFPRELAAIQRALQRAEQTGARLLVARGRLFEGRSYYSQGELRKAENSLEAARQMFIDAGDRAGAASALNSLGSVLGDQQDITRSQRMYEQSLATSEEIGDRRAMSAALNNLGVLLKDQGQLVEARRAHERSLALRREIGDRNWTAVSLSNIGVVLFEEDRLREATAYYKESLAICREIGDKRGLVRALHNLAIVQREMGQLAEARGGFEESLAVRAEIGDTRGQVMGRVELGMVLLEQGEIGAARTSQEEAVRLASQTRLKPGEAQARFQLGEIAMAAGNLTESRHQHEQALALRQEMKETRTLLESQVALAVVALEDGRPAEAEDEAQSVIRSLGQMTAAMRPIAELVTARARLAGHDIAGAARALATAGALSERTERLSLKSELAMVEAEIAVAEGRTDDARRRLNALGTTLRQSGLVLHELERRLLVLRIDRAEGRPGARADAVALEKEARARGAGLIAKRAMTPL